MKKAPKFITIATLSLISTTQKNLLRLVEARLRKKQKTIIFTPNPEFVVYASKHSWFRDVLIQSDINIPDGIGLVWLARFLGRPIKQRIAGVDLMLDLCRLASKKGWLVYLLGAGPGVAESAEKKLRQRFKGLKVCSDSGPRLEIDEKTGRLSPLLEIDKAVKRINEKKPHMLFVAFGMGKQEKFIADNKDKFQVGLAMGVGGSFDFISGKAKRAPLWLREKGLEWLYRLIREPWRLKRQTRLLKFIFLGLKEKFRK